jgi:hypothetical protein
MPLMTMAVAPVAQDMTDQECAAWSGL